MPDGWLILDKPPGLGSTQAVSAVKRNLREAGYGKVKVGHGGTLDPLAEGVLPIALGEATKLAGRMLDSDKTYEFAIEFGSETDTLDAERGPATRARGGGCFGAQVEIELATAVIVEREQVGAARERLQRAHRRRHLVGPAASKDFVLQEHRNRHCRLHRSAHLSPG